jgi:uncharacterized protein
MAQVVNWFEIPATDFERAVRFYSAILDRPLPTGEYMGVPHAFFRDGQGETGGAIIASAQAMPGHDGVVIYLHADDLDAALARVPAAGGTVAVPATSIGEQGAFGVVVDTEGNRVGLHRPAQG